MSKLTKEQIEKLKLSNEEIERFNQALDEELEKLYQEDNKINQDQN